MSIFSQHLRNRERRLWTDRLNPKDQGKAAEQRRRVFEETLPPPARIMDAANRYSAEASKIYLEAAIRTALVFERALARPGGPTPFVPPAPMTVIVAQAEAYRRGMRDAYLTAALEMLKMIGGDFEPEPWDLGEAPEAEQSSKLNTEELRICELYQQLTEEPGSQERRTNDEG